MRTRFLNSCLHLNKHIYENRNPILLSLFCLLLFLICLVLHVVLLQYWYQIFKQVIKNKNVGIVMTVSLKGFDYINYENHLS